MSAVLMAVLAASAVTLEEVRAASKENLEAVRAELELDKARLARRQARASIYPQVSLSAGASDFIAGPQRVFSTVPVVRSDGTVGYEQRSVDVDGTSRGNFSLGLTVSQLLYDGGRWWTQIAQAGAQQEAAAGQLDEQRLASELEAVRRFYELVRAQLTLQVLEASVGRSRDQLARAQSMYEAARVQRRDVLDAEVNLGNDRIQALRQRQALDATQIELLRWLGRPIAEIAAVAPDTLDLKRSPPPPPEPARALEQARARRPLFRALAAQLRATELAVEVAGADYLPRVSAQVGYSRSSPTADPFFTDPTRQNALSLGLSLSWDLFSGFATESAVARARTELTGVKAQQAQAVLELEGEIRRAVKALGTSVEVAALAAKNEGLAKAELELEEQRFAAGAGSSIDVRNAQVKVTQAELTLLQARIDVEIARAALDRSIGGSVEATP